MIYFDPLTIGRIVDFFREKKCSVCGRPAKRLGGSVRAPIRKGSVRKGKEGTYYCHIHYPPNNRGFPKKQKRTYKVHCEIPVTSEESFL